MKIRTILFFSIIPFVFGFTMMRFSRSTKISVNFETSNVMPTDIILLSSRGNIFKLDKNGYEEIISGHNLIEPIVVGNSVAAIYKTTNFSSLIMYDPSVNKTKTLFNGDTGNLDTMSWITDPATSPDGKRIAYVSDKDRQMTGVPDNALYVLNLADGKSTNIAQPDPYSGGLAHPIFNPQDSNIVLYDYYQYNPETSVPYSTIEEFNKKTGRVRTLTFEGKNAYQASFSPDGKKLLFLGRLEDKNLVTLYLADYDDNGLSNFKALAVGDFAHPVFSFTDNKMYFLKAQKNNGYNLMTATIQDDKLIDIKTIVSGNELLGNSSFNVVKN